MEFAVTIGCWRKESLTRLVGISLIRFRTTAVSLIVLTSLSSSDSRLARHLGLFRGVVGAVRGVVRNISLSSPVKSRSTRWSKVLLSIKAVCFKGRNAKGGGGG
jgi:hypothetical protein